MSHNIIIHLCTLYYVYLYVHLYSNKDLLFIHARVTQTHTHKAHMFRINYARTTRFWLLSHCCSRTRPFPSVPEPRRHSVYRIENDANDVATTFCFSTASFTPKTERLKPCDRHRQHAFARARNTTLRTEQIKNENRMARHQRRKRSRLCRTKQHRTNTHIQTTTTQQQRQ